MRKSEVSLLLSQFILYVQNHHVWLYKRDPHPVYGEDLSAAEVKQLYHDFVEELFSD